jgi:localization factor PodJL
MQPDLPWNVAGIPPEAREAARAAARREGLSVGEWLTRKILRGLSDTARGYETTPPEIAADTWRSAPMAPTSPAAYRNAAESAANAARDTEDMLARVSRSEDEAQSSYRRIEDQLKNVARRLDSAERSQSENNRAMGKAAAEINVAAREQAQAFDQLDAHVIALADRLSRVEQTAKDSGLRDAVKGLHQGLSRLADQIAETANRSATQVSTLAENVESLAGRLAQTRHDAETAARALKDHLVAVDQRVHAIEANEGPTKALTQLRETLEGLSSRVRAIEANDGPAKTLAQLRETLDGLSSRVQTTDAQTAGAMARLEDSVHKLESREDGGRFDRRLQGIEQSLAELMSRAGHDAEQASIAAMEDELRALNARMEGAEHAHREEVAELRAALEKAETKPLAMPAPPPVAAPAPQPSGFDLPPFPQAQPVPPPPAEAMRPAFASPPPFAADAPGFAPEPNFVPPFDQPVTGGPEAPDQAGSAFAALGQQQAYRPTPMDASSYISSTRRNARAAAEAQQAGAHGWASGTPADDAGKPRTRYALIGAIFAIALIAVVGGSMLFRNIAAHRPATPTPAPASVSAAVPPPGSIPAIAPSLSGKPAAPSTVTAVQPPAAGETTHAAPPPAVHEAKPASHPAPAEHAAAKPQPAKQQTAAISPFARLTAGAEAGNATAQTILGLDYVDGNGVAVNEAEGARWLERAARQGQPVAEYRLGTLYERGHGVPADAKLAASWYAAAAKAGNRKAMHNLAVAFVQGSGLQKNLTAAAQWFTKAAELGLRDSQFNLAVLYERGMGVPQSLTDAFKWYAVAAAQGDAESKARIAALSTQISPDDRAAAERSAQSFQPQPLDRASNVPPTIADLKAG